MPSSWQSSEKRDISPDKSQAAHTQARVDEEGTAERRFYVVFEVTRGQNKNTIDEKLLQLERDLTFLLLRQRALLKIETSDLTLLDVVAYAGIATPQDKASFIIGEKLSENRTKWPLLMQLVVERRFLVFVGQPSLFETISLSTSNASPTDPGIAAERLKREQLLTQIEVDAKKKKEEMLMLRAQIDAARDLGKDDLVQQLSSQLERLCQPIPHLLPCHSSKRGGRRPHSHRGRGRGKSDASPALTKAPDTKGKVDAVSLLLKEWYRHLL